MSIGETFSYKGAVPSEALISQGYHKGVVAFNGVTFPMPEFRSSSRQIVDSYRPNISAIASLTVLLKVSLFFQAFSNCISKLNLQTFVFFTCYYGRMIA